MSTLFLSSCAQETGRKSSQSLQNSKAPKNGFNERLEQAKLIDIPIPLGFKLINKTESPTSAHHTYAGSLSRIDVKNLYLKELERHGWNIIDISSSDEELLFCKKRNQYCAVSLRNTPQSSKNQVRPTLIHLFVQGRIDKSTFEHDASIILEELDEPPIQVPKEYHVNKHS